MKSRAHAGRAAVLMALLSLGGCVLRVPQLELVGAMFDPASDSEMSEALAQFAWVLHWQGVDTRVYAVTVADGTLFVDGTGLQVRFNGEAVSEVTQLLPGGSELHVESKGEGRLWFREDGTVIKEVQCAPWVRRARSSGGSIFEQHCPGFREPNQRWHDEANFIDKLAFTFHPDHPRVVLEKRL